MYSEWTQQLEAKAYLVMKSGWSDSKVRSSTVIFDLEYTLMELRTDKYIRCTVYRVYSYKSQNKQEREEDTNRTCSFATVLNVIATGQLARVHIFRRFLARI